MVIAPVENAMATGKEFLGQATANTWPIQNTLGWKIKCG